MQTPSPPRRAEGRGAPAIDLHALRAFVAICESGSMVEAARQLGVTQSAVSQSMRTLERHLGSELFDRDYRPSRPTATGRLLLELSTELLSHAESVTDRIRSSSRSSQAHIRMGCVDSFAATLGPDLILAMAETARQIVMWSGLSPSLSAQMANRELDLAVCTDPAIPTAGIRQTLLFSECFVMVVPRQADPSLQHYQEAIQAHGLIRYSQRSVIAQQIDRYLRHLGVASTRHFEFDATDPMLSLVASGLGCAVTTPICLWQSRAYLDEVRVLPMPTSTLGQRSFFLMCREGEWAQLTTLIGRVTRLSLERKIWPALRARAPEMPMSAVSFR